MKKIICAFCFVFYCLIILFGCKKMATKSNDILQAEETQSMAGLGTACEETNSSNNQTLLNLVLSGSGGSFDTETGPIEFPAYTPPVNDNGMLSFASMDDYNKFMSATYLMEDYWEYSDIDYEDKPEEIEHLGEEPLNALDCALNFNSLRYQYEISDFYDDNWEDTVAINVDDFDYQVVLNTNHEVKIGDTYYKYLANNIVAIIEHDNVDALDLVRNYGIFAVSDDISLFNETTGQPENIDRPDNIQGCEHFTAISHAVNLTPTTSTANQWEVELTTTVLFWIPGQPANDYSAVKANYHVDWGDGTATDFVGPFVHNNTIRHIYNQVVAPGSSVLKTISVTCQMIYPQDQSFALDYLISDCPSIVSEAYMSTATVSLSTPAPQDCLWGTHKRKFNGQQQTVGGKQYRLECKLIHKSNPVFGFPHIKAKATFRKKKNNHWKKTKPLSSVIINLRGDVYNINTGACGLYDADAGCSDLFTVLNKTKSTTKRKKLKLKTGDTELPCFVTNRTLPFAINADFIWTYGSGQSVSNLNEKIIQ